MLFDAECVNSVNDLDRAGILFGIIFGAANAYLGLRVGLTISTSIPIAVLGVLVFTALPPFGKMGSILETNLAQTIGSASSSLASGMIFTIPALYYWEADGKLAFYYCCIGLGFTGMYEDDPKHLHDIMQRLEPRVRSFMDRDVISRITPEAYSHNLEINVAPDTAPRYLGLLFLAIGTGFAITVSILYLYIDTFSSLSKVLTKIISS